jgi:hypothetical protein
VDNTVIREQLDKLYNEATMMGRLRTGSPINHMIDGAMKLISEAEHQAELRGRLDENQNWHNTIRNTTGYIGKRKFRERIADLTKELEKS